VTISPLIREIRDIVQKARLTIAQNVNSIQVVTNFEMAGGSSNMSRKGSRRQGMGNRPYRSFHVS
jgi:hypothetical protein